MNRRERKLLPKVEEFLKGYIKERYNADLMLPGDFDVFFWRHLDTAIFKIGSRVKLYYHDEVILYRNYRPEFNNEYSPSELKTWKRKRIMNISMESYLHQDFVSFEGYKILYDVMAISNNVKGEMALVSPTIKDFVSSKAAERFEDLYKFL